MIKVINKHDCCGCNACRTICPHACITMVADVEGFLYPEVQHKECLRCGMCVRACPMSLEEPTGDLPVTLVGWNKDAGIRSTSSSGGIFTALMQQTLREGGIVIGAGFDSSMNLLHMSADVEANCGVFRGSKYLQSSIGDTFAEAKHHLQQGRQVLFSGTPCQVAGLYSFLGISFHNLLTCDVVCHGVPSPKVFKAYLNEIERHRDTKVQCVSFRRKDKGWKKFSIALSFNDGTEYSNILTQDPFMRGFLDNLFLRPSCHACRFSRLPRVADLSLGDFWGVGAKHPEWDDDKGTSVILVQTQKGHQALQSCANDLFMHDADLSEAISHNPCICHSVSPSKRRTAFFEDLDRIAVRDWLLKYLAAPNLWCRIFVSLKMVGSRILRKYYLFRNIF